MWWVIVLAPLLLISVAAWIPLQLSAMATVDDAQIAAQATVCWACWRLWRWPAPVAADGSNRQSSPAPQQAEGEKQASEAAPTRRPKRPGRLAPAVDFAELWPLCRKYWRHVLRLVHCRFTGDLSLELSDAALAGWLFAAAGATGWPPAQLRLQLGFGRTNRLVGRVQLAVRLYPAEVIGLLLRLACEPPIRRAILQQIKHRQKVAKHQ